MAQTCTYLNFERNTEEAFNFYKTVFGGDFMDGKINRFRDVPAQEGMQPIAEADKDLVMHVALPIHGGHLLMGTDAPKSMGFTVNKGNNVHILLYTDSRSQADTLFGKLSSGGNADMPLQDMFWGDYYGTLTDKFGIKWMITYHQVN